MKKGTPPFIRVACSVWLLIALFFLISPAQAQDTPTVYENGRAFRLHTVERKETLYGISKKYNVHIDTLRALNPEVAKEMKTGSQLRIPLPGKTIPSSVQPGGETAGERMYMHTIVQGETLFSLSQKYGVSIQTLTELNPETAKTFKAGEKLKIPLTKPVAAIPDTSQMAVLPPDAGMDGEYRIALLLPLNLNEEFDSSSRKKEDLLSTEEKINNKSLGALEFYEGVKMAADSLARQGLKITLHVFDTEGDSLKTVSIFNKNEMKQMDLVIGPVFHSNMAVATRFCQQHKIPLASPFLNSSALLAPNPLISLATPTVNTQCILMAGYLSQNIGTDTVLIVHSGKSREKEIASLFKAGMTASSREIIFGKEGIEGIRKAMHPLKENLIVIPSTDEAFVSQVMLKLINDTGRYKMKVAGLPPWENFETLDPDFFPSLNVHFFSTFFVDYDAPPVLRFRRSFRELYNDEPSSYVFHGFDVMYFYGIAMKQFGKGFHDHLTELKLNAMHTEYNFHRPDPGGGTENKYISVVKYEDYKLVKLNK